MWGRYPTLPAVADAGGCASDRDFVGGGCFGRRRARIGAQRESVSVSLAHAVRMHGGTCGTGAAPNALATVGYVQIAIIEAHSAGGVAAFVRNAGWGRRVRLRRTIGRGIAGDRLAAGAGSVSAG
jgi:hypothetical protein